MTSGASYDDAWTNGITPVIYGDYAGITNPPTIPGAYDDGWTNSLDVVAFAGEVDPFWSAQSNLYAREIVLNSVTSTTSIGRIDLGTISGAAYDDSWTGGLDVVAFAGEADPVYLASSNLVWVPTHMHLNYPFVTNVITPVATLKQWDLRDAVTNAVLAVFEMQMTTTGAAGLRRSRVYSDGTNATPDCTFFWPLASTANAIGFGWSQIGTNGGVAILTDAASNNNYMYLRGYWQWRQVE